MRMEGGIGSSPVAVGFYLKWCSAVISLDIDLMISAALLKERRHLTQTDQLQLKEMRHCQFSSPLADAENGFKIDT